MAYKAIVELRLKGKQANDKLVHLNEITFKCAQWCNIIIFEFNVLHFDANIVLVIKCKIMKLVECHETLKI